MPNALLQALMGQGDYSATPQDPRWQAVAPTYGKIPYGNDRALAQMVLDQGMPGWSRPNRDFLTGQIRGYMNNTPGYRQVPSGSDFRKAVGQLEPPVTDPGYEPPFPKLWLQPQIDRLGR